jgi:peptidoglycan LD-endopeptidase LytH
MPCMSQGNDGRERLQRALQRTRPWLERLGGVFSAVFAGLLRGLLKVGEWLGRIPWARIRPGWYVMAALAVWSLIASANWLSLSGQLTEAQARLEVYDRQAALENAKLSFPIAGAGLPRDDDHLPNAPRTYRKGVSQGFVFTGSDSGVSVAFGTPVVAAADGDVTKLDASYKEPTVPEFLKLLTEVKNGASTNDLERLRGRQVWLKHKNGTVTRYGHLSKIAPSLSYANPVKRGDVIGYVGNSGTLEGARGTKNNARLLFEVWFGGDVKFLGQELKPGEVRAQATKLFRPF